MFGDVHAFTPLPFEQQVPILGAFRNNSATLHPRLLFQPAEVTRALHLKTSSYLTP